MIENLHSWVDIYISVLLYEFILSKKAFLVDSYFRIVNFLLVFLQYFYIQIFLTTSFINLKGCKKKDIATP